MEKILVYTNLTTSADVVKVEGYLGCSEYEFEFETNYYNHCRRDHKQYAHVFGLVDTASHIVSDEYRKDLLMKCRTLQEKRARIVLINLWESKDQINKTAYPKLLQDFDYLVWHGGMTFFWWLMYERYRKQQFYFEHSQKYFDFMYLNKAQRHHRDLLFDSLINKGLLDKSLYSYHHRGIALDQKYEMQQYRDSYPQYGADRDIFERPYNDSAWNIVSETSVDEKFITEKTWKPILAKQPFIVHGYSGILADLRQLGFNTFSDWIDESYDTLQDLASRTKSIVGVCESVMKQDYENVYSKTTDAREHNHRLFFDGKKLSEAVTKDVNLLLEF